MTSSQGTPRYIARTIQKGEDKDVSTKQLGHRFPILTGTARNLYLAKYGEKTYEEYTNNFDKAPPYKEKVAGYKFLHRPHHDMESVIWVLIDGLVHAWPVDSEQDVTSQAETTMGMLQNHVILSYRDSRDGIEQYKKEMWLKILHPKMHFLAEMMVELSKFLHGDWSLWMNNNDNGALKPDFLHEALKRLLLQAIVWIQEKQEEHTDIQICGIYRGILFPSATNRNRMQEEGVQEEGVQVLVETDAVRGCLLAPLSGTVGVDFLPVPRC
jgi:hypothetical protein